MSRRLGNGKWKSKRARRATRSRPSMGSVWKTLANLAFLPNPVMEMLKDAKQVGPDPKVLSVTIGVAEDYGGSDD